MWYAYSFVCAISRAIKAKQDQDLKIGAVLWELLELCDSREGGGSDTHLSQTHRIRCRRNLRRLLQVLSQTGILRTYTIPL